MDIQYFYVGDHIQNKTLSLHHCPTKEMLADYFTKPLQGYLFVHLRNHIMGAEFEDGDPKTHRSVLGCQDDHETMEASETGPASIRMGPEWSFGAGPESREYVCGECDAGPE